MLHFEGLRKRVIKNYFIIIITTVTLFEGLFIFYVQNYYYDSVRQNLKNQVQIYEKANDTKKSIKIILYFTEKEKERVDKILKELNLMNDGSIILIDAINNKKSASNVK